MKNLDLLLGVRAVIVASTGGHLTQSVKWAHRLQFDSRSTFVTFDSAQSRSLLRGYRTLYVPYVRPRDVLAVLRAAYLLCVTKELRNFDAVVSTGAGLALAGLPLAWISGKPFYYIESVSRFDGPSLTGRIMERTPGVQRFSQHDYNSARWTSVKSLLSSYSAKRDEKVGLEERPLKIFVSLGTIKPYRFDRLVDNLLPALGTQDSVTWQLGETTRTDLPGVVFDHIDARRFEELSAEADVVVTHAGVGTLMALLDAGQRPMVSARTSALQEHVDDHQMQVTRKLATLGLVAPFSSELTRSELLEAAAWSICDVESFPDESSYEGRPPSA